MVKVSRSSPCWRTFNNQAHFWSFAERSHRPDSPDSVFIGVCTLPYHQPTSMLAARIASRSGSTLFRHLAAPRTLRSGDSGSYFSSLQCLTLLVILCFGQCAWDSCTTSGTVFGVMGLVYYFGHGVWGNVTSEFDCMSNFDIGLYINVYLALDCTRMLIFIAAMALAFVCTAPLLDPRRLCSAWAWRRGRADARRRSRLT